MSIDYETLSALLKDHASVETPCPECSPHRQKANQDKKCLRIWRKDEGFLTFSCAHCGAKGYVSDGTARRVDRREVQRRMREAELHQLDTDAEKQRKARWLWGQSRPAVGTVVQTYLRSRGISICPPTVRMLPARGDHPPAMLVPFGMPIEPVPGRYELGSAGVSAVHITRLMSDGSGKAADGKGRSKIMLGATLDCPLALVPPNDLGGLAIAEGIEDALSISQATGLGAWAAGAAVRLKKMAAPIERCKWIETVCIATDDDEDGRAGAHALVLEINRLRPDIEATCVLFRSANHEAA